MGVININIVLMFKLLLILCLTASQFYSKSYLVESQENHNGKDYQDQDQECCKIPGGLTNDNIGRCKEAICGQGLVCGYEGFDDIKLALCGTDYQDESKTEIKDDCKMIGPVEELNPGPCEA